MKTRYIDFSTLVSHDESQVTFIREGFWDSKEEVGSSHPFRESLYLRDLVLSGPLNGKSGVLYSQQDGNKVYWRRR